MKGKALQRAGAAWDVGPQEKCPEPADHMSLPLSDNLLAGTTVLHHASDNYHFATGVLCSLDRPSACTAYLLGR